MALETEPEMTPASPSCEAEREGGRERGREGGGEDEGGIKHKPMKKEKAARDERR